MGAVVQDIEELVDAPTLVEMLASGGYGRWDEGTLRKWIAHPSQPCPVARLGKPGRSHLFKYADVCAWLDSREAAQARAADPQVELATQRARLIRLEADKKEGLLVPADQVEPALARVVDATRAALLSFPHLLADRCGLTDEQRAIAHAEVIRLLERMASGETADADDEATA